MARQRGGSTALVSGAQTAFATSLGFCVSQNSGLTIEELYGFNWNGQVNVINKTTGAASNMGAIGVSVSGVIVGRPVRHFGFVMAPWKDLGVNARQAAIAAGATVTTTFTSTVTVTIVAGDPQITLTGADVTTNVVVGAIVQILDTNTFYVGRVVSIDTTKKFTVWPVPTWSTIGTPQVTTSGIYGGRAGTCAASFQNRLLYGNTIDASASSNTLVADRRVYYSPLPTESTLDPAPLSLTMNLGAYFVAGIKFWPKLNYFEVPGADPIVAMEPINDNQLLILTSTRPVVFSGNLTTQLATTSPTVTFDISDTNQPAGCLSDLSVHRTKRGIVWAGPGGVHAWNGRSVDTLTGDAKTKRIASYWQSLASDATFVIHGASYVRDHYIVSGTSGGTTFSLMCNMANLQWTRLSGVGTDNFFSVARPTVPQQVYGLRWWDQAGAAPSMTNGQTVRLEPMMAPYVSGATKTDADGTAVTLSLTTPVIDGGREQTQKIAQRLTVRHQQSSTTAAVAVTGQSKIDAADIDASSVRALGSLSNTATLTVSNATNANPIVVTTGTHGLQTDDFVDIDGVIGNLNANGRWRIAVINSTSFSLVGGIGSAAYTSGGKVKKVTETDYLASPLNAGQGFSLKFDGAPNNWEYHGATIAVFEKDPVESA